MGVAVGGTTPGVTGRRGRRRRRVPSVPTPTPCPCPCPLAALALAAGSTALGPAGAPRRRGAGGAVVLLGHGPRLARDLLRRCRAQHVAELARLLLRLLRPLGHRLGGQAARRLLAAGAVAAGVRLPPLGLRPAERDRGHAHRARPLPRGAPGRWGRGGTHRGRRAGGHAGHDLVEPGQHLGLAAGPAARPGRRRRHQRLPLGPPGRAGPRRRLGRTGFPGQDAPGLARPARPLPGLPAGRPGRRPGATLRARGALSPGRRRRVAQLDVRRHPGAGARPALRRRQLRQLGVQPGLPLQRRRPPDGQHPGPARLHQATRLGDLHLDRRGGDGLARHGTRPLPQRPVGARRRLAVPPGPGRPGRPRPGPA